jgi:hypothetical protein
MRRFEASKTSAGSFVGRRGVRRVAERLRGFARHVLQVTKFRCHRLEIKPALISLGGLEGGGEDEQVALEHKGVEDISLMEGRKWREHRYS